MEKYSGKLTLKNDFHNTETVVVVKDGVITARSMQRAFKILCGIKDCQCGGIRGPQDMIIDTINRGNDVGNYRVDYK